MLLASFIKGQSLFDDYTSLNPSDRVVCLMYIDIWWSLCQCLKFMECTRGVFCVDKRGRFCQKGLLHWKCKRKNGWKILNVVQFSFLKVNRNITVTIFLHLLVHQSFLLRKKKKWKFTSFVHEYDKCIANVFFITRCPT